MQEHHDNDHGFHFTDEQLDQADFRLSPAANYPSYMNDMEILMDLYRRYDTALPRLTALLEDAEIRCAFRNPVEWKRRHLAISHSFEPDADEIDEKDAASSLVDELLENGTSPEQIRERTKAWVDEAIAELSSREDTFMALNALAVMAGEGKIGAMPMLRSICEWSRFVNAVKRAYEKCAAEAEGAVAGKNAGE